MLPECGWLYFLKVATGMFCLRSSPIPPVKKWAILCLNVQNMVEVMLCDWGIQDNIASFFPSLSRMCHRNADLSYEVWLLVAAAQERRKGTELERGGVATVWAFLAQTADMKVRKPWSDPSPSISFTQLNETLSKNHLIEPRQHQNYTHK
jgi:hypothetical protein